MTRRRIALGLLGTGVGLVAWLVFAIDADVPRHYIVIAWLGGIAYAWGLAHLFEALDPDDRR